MERSCCAVIVAAGGSTRMGCPKQTLVLEGASVIAWTLRAFEEARSVSSIVLVIREEDKAAMEDMVARYGISKPVFFAAGGRERQLSVYHGLLAVPSDAEYVAVHDGARFLVTPEEIDMVINAAGPEMGTALAVCVKDTIKEVDAEGIVVSTPARETLRAVQTPQVFPFARFLGEMEQAVAEERYYTDDCQLWEHAGLPVRLCEGSYENLKLTTPEDRLMAEAILRKRGKRL